MEGGIQEREKRKKEKEKKRKGNDRWIEKRERRWRSSGRRFFHWYGLYPGTSYCFGSCFEVCTRKKHVRPLKTRAWMRERGNGRREGQRRIEGGRRRERERKGSEREAEGRRTGTRIRGVQSGGGRKGGGSERPLRHRRVCACVRACVCVKKNGESRRKAKSTGGGSVEEDTKRRRDEPPWLVSTRGMRMNAGCKRESIRKGNRWMGLAAYPANAPSDIAVTWT